MNRRREIERNCRPREVIYRFTETLTHRLVTPSGRVLRGDPKAKVWSDGTHVLFSKPDDWDDEKAEPFESVVAWSEERDCS